MFVVDIKYWALGLIILMHEFMKSEKQLLKLSRANIVCFRETFYRITFCYSLHALAITGAYFGDRSTNYIWTRTAGCDGSLLDCLSNATNCIHQEDSGVICSNHGTYIYILLAKYI